MALATRSAFTLSGLRAAAPRVAQQQARRAAVVVRAAEEPKSEEAPASVSGTYFYKGKSYTEAEWKEAVANGTVNQAAETPAAAPAAAAVGEALSLGQLMAFSGPAPELINGRLAMLAFVAALGAELSTGESVLRQLSEEPTGIVLGALAFITASLIPLIKSTKREAFGPFTPAAEMLNGRAAMIGFASLLAIEISRGTALF